MTFSALNPEHYKQWREAFDEDLREYNKDWNDFDTDLREYNSVRIIQTEGVVSLGMERYITDVWKWYYGDADPHHTYTTTTRRICFFPRRPLVLKYLFISTNIWCVSLSVCSLNCPSFSIELLPCDCANLFPKLTAVPGGGLSGDPSLQSSDDMTQV